jgi:hypothetical protein
MKSQELFGATTVVICFMLFSFLSSSRLAAKPEGDPCRGDWGFKVGWSDGSELHCFKVRCPPKIIFYGKGYVIYDNDFGFETYGCSPDGPTVGENCGTFYPCEAKNSSFINSKTPLSSMGFFSRVISYISNDIYLEGY